jgi:hypothetical protein
LPRRVAATLGRRGLLISRNTSALVKLAAEIQEPTPEQMQRMMVIRKSQAIVGPLNIILLVIAITVATSYIWLSSSSRRRPAAGSYADAGCAGQRL